VTVRRINTLFAVIMISAVFYFAMLPSVFRHLSPVTGDEPFYIMTAISMFRDRNLDETSNYANRDYEEFYPEHPLPADWQGWPAFPRTLPPHPAVTERDGLYTKHALGLSALIAVPYELAGRAGAVLLVLICAVLLSGQMFLFSRESSIPERYAALTAIALAVSMPLAPYAMLIFPEIPAALLILYTIRRLSSSENTTGRWILTGVAIGFLPWLHQRFAVMSVVFAAAILIHLWQKRTYRPAVALVPVAAGGFSIIAYNFWLYGQPTQNIEDHDGFSGVTGTLNGAAGLALDAQWGLFIAMPVALFALAAIPRWARMVPFRAMLCFASVIPYLIIVAAYQVWWGEWGPPARYLVPIVPLLSAPLAAWLWAASRTQRLAAGLAWMVGMVLTFVGFANPQRFYHHPDGVNNLYSTIGDALGIDLAGYLTAFQFYSPGTSSERIGWALAAIVVVVLLTIWIESRRHPATEAHLDVTMAFDHQPER
jgi:hypothetical protein